MRKQDDLRVGDDRARVYVDRDEQLTAGRADGGQTEGQREYTPVRSG